MSVAPIGPGSTQLTQNLSLSPRQVGAPAQLARTSLADRTIAPGDFRGQTLRISGRVAQLERASIETHRASDQLADLDKLITELETIVARASTAPAEEIISSQARVDEIVDSIASHTHGPTETAPPRIGRGPGSEVIDVAQGISVLDAQAKLRPGESIDANVQITASAQTAGFFLSFGGNTLNLGGAGAADGANSTFIIDVEGADGLRQFSYASGTSLQDIAGSINAFAEVTGVVAVVSGTGVVLRSVDFGSSEFVSVKVLDDGSLNTAVAQAGVYDFEAGDTGAAVTTGQLLFSVATNKVTDQGQDIAALVNGIAATGVGRTLNVETNTFSATFELSADLAQSIDEPFTAFTLASRVQPPSGSNGPNPPGRPADRPASPPPLASQLKPIHSGGAFALTNDASLDGAQETVGLARTTIDQRQAALDAQRQILSEELGLATSQLTGLVTTSTTNTEPLNPQRTAELLRMELFKQA